MITKLLSIVGRINSDRRVKYSYADTPFMRKFEEKYSKSKVKKEQAVKQFLEKLK